MRWIFLVLLFANAGYFVWGYYHQSHKPYRTVSVDTEVPVQAGKRLMLLSEADIEPAESKLSRKETREKSEAQCLVVGPFESSYQADQLQQKLFSLGVASRERSDSETVLADYWVHIPPRSNRQSAIRLLRELQGQGIDSFVITQGELANGISLGLFSKESSANEVSRRVQEAGYEPSIKKLPREPETFWLEMTDSEAAKLSEGFWEKQAGEYNDLKMLEKNCKSVASDRSIH
ncbi:SPOR domain-containing protein [Endozoicomonas arenosclerae]|uniref:SPOR domain-containing protein n=1 Tax=Endozoicomonas arenosclerae TaxID=1633495 RepID=UPI0007858404|nr:SPOR domain-containing protein [Endozoicomonas arenosclerae]